MPAVTWLGAHVLHVKGAQLLERVIQSWPQSLATKPPGLNLARIFLRDEVRIGIAHSKIVASIFPIILTCSIESAACFTTLFNVRTEYLAWGNRSCRACLLGNSCIRLRDRDSCKSKLFGWKGYFERRKNLISPTAHLGLRLGKWRHAQKTVSRAFAWSYRIRYTLFPCLFLLPF